MLAVSLELTEHRSVYLSARLRSFCVAAILLRQMKSIKLCAFKIISGKILFLQSSLNPRSSSGRGWDFPFQSRLIPSGTWFTSGLSWVFCNVPGTILLKEEKIIPLTLSDLVSPPCGTALPVRGVGWGGAAWLSTGAGAAGVMGSADLAGLELALPVGIAVPLSRY